MADIGNSLFVVGIDIGSEYSGYAFSIVNEFRESYRPFETSWWQGYSKIKCPTAILLDKTEQMVDFGDKTETRFADLMESDEHHDYYFFKNFRNDLHLQRENGNPMIKDVSGKPLEALKVFSQIIGYLKHDVMKKIRHQGMINLFDEDNYFVLTVPATWDSKEKDFMKTAAMMAGIKEHKMRIIIEPHAASLLMLQKDSDVVKRIKMGEKYMVIDLGGSLKVTYHRNYQNITIEEIVAPSGGPWAGKSIDDAFYTFLCEICGTEIMESFRSEEREDYYIDLFNAFEMKKQSICSKQRNAVVIALPDKLLKLVREKHTTVEKAIEQSPYKKNVIYSKFKLHIPPDTFRGLFEPTIRAIITHIKEMQKNPKVEDINILMMVGGFSKCKLVQDAMHLYFGESKSIVIDNDPETTIMKGAALSALQPITTEEDSILNSLSKMNAHDFKDLISKGHYASYENRVYLAGACNIGKSSLASILIGDEVPKKWYSTDGLVIHFGRNGIHLKDRKMIPLVESDSNILKKMLLGKPDMEETKTKYKESNLLTHINDRVHPKEGIEPTRNVSSAHKKEHISSRKTTDEAACAKKPLTERPRLLNIRKSREVKGGAVPKLKIHQVSSHTAANFQKSVLQEIKNGTYKIRVAPSDLIDFGGQRSFDMTHQLFIQYKGTFVLMFDGRYGLTSRLKEYPEGNITAKDILVHWVNSILLYCGEGDDKMPVILFAATHSDIFCAENISVEKQKFIGELTKLFQNHNQRKHILYDRVFFINATNREDLEIEFLKDALVDIAFQQPTWGQRMPVAWVPLELQISEWRTQGINLIAKEDIQKFNKSNPEFMLNEVRLEGFLKIQHSLGKIMYIDQPGLQNFIVIQPTAMVNILRSFVTDKIFWPKDFGLRQILASIAKTGIVEKKQLFSLWSQPQLKQLLPSNEHREYIIQVLVHLDILVEPKRDNTQGPKCEAFLVPCLVNSTIPVEVLKFEEGKTICLAYKLTERIIPTGLSFKLIGAAVTTWPLKELNGRNCLYFQSAIMQVDEYNELCIQIEGQRVIVFLSNRNSKYFISPDVAASIQECLTLALERALIFYHECFGRSTAKFNLMNLVEIEVGEMCKRNIYLLPLSQARKKQQWSCSRGEKHETKYCLYWVFNRHKKNCNKGCRGLATEALSLTPTDQHLVRLAKQLDIQEFDKFFIYLGMTRAEWEEVEHRFIQNEILCRKLMALYRWKKKTVKVRLHDLLDGLKKIERDHYLCQIVREETNLFGIAESRLQSSPSDEVLEKLSRQLGNCVIQLGIELGLSFNSIEETMYRLPKDMYGQIHDILKKWKREITKPTIYRLMMAVQRVESGGLSFLQDQYK